MLYNEFIEGTGCQDNDHNYKVYKDLEIMYMNSTISKEEIYEYGKKLVDNSKPEHIQRLEAELKQELKDLKAEIKENKEKAKYYDQDAEYLKSIGMDKTHWGISKSWAKSYREENKKLRARINQIKFILEN